VNSEACRGLVRLFGTNILLNLLVLTGLLRFVLKMPDDIVFGRILPACGLMLFMSTMY
jgi:AGZA family xanthine/uracil permease-like MFS transporter